jgi:hypothetical protein
MFGCSPHPEARRTSSGWLLIASLLVACGHQDGIVGAEPLGAAGRSSAGFLEEFAAPNDAWRSDTILTGAATSVGDVNRAARDGYGAELRFPGHPEYAAGQQVGAQFVTQLATRERYQFGTYRTRLSYGACAAGEETVMAFLGYFNDGRDHDGDGIVDDLEIDVQVACGAPRYMYLTVFTDDEEPPQGTRFRKLTRVVDFTTGDTFDTQAPDSEQYGPPLNDPLLLAPELLIPGALYELGFEWHEDSIRFFMVIGGVERDLWTLSGVERIPQLPVQLMYNLWHPDTHWYPAEGSADFPANDVIMNVDWLSFEPE